MPEPVLLAFYVRDLAGIGPFVLPDLPPLVPKVEEQLRPPTNRGRATAEWERWWRSIDDELLGLLPAPRPPQWHGLEAAPTLRGLLEEHFNEACSWVRAAQVDAHRPGSLHLTHFVNGFEQRLARPVRPFLLRMTEVPVNGAQGWILTDTHVLVSSLLLRDEPALEAFLDPVVQRLA